MKLWSLLLVGAIALTASPATAQRASCLLTGYKGRISQSQYLEARAKVGQKASAVLDILRMPYCKFGATFVYLLDRSSVQVIFGDDGTVLEIIVLGRFANQ